MGHIMPFLQDVVQVSGMTRMYLKLQLKIQRRTFISPCCKYPFLDGSKNMFSCVSVPLQLVPQLLQQQ